MTLFQAIVLGTIQGLTEFLPISSSGHLIFLPRIFGWTDQGLSFDVVVHMGSLLAVIIYFRHRLYDIILSFVKKESGIKNLESGITNSRRLGWLIILSIIPAGVGGLLLGDWIEVTFRSTTVIAVNLIFWGIVLWLADLYGQKLKINNATKNLEKIGWKEAIFIGCAQAVALIPGTSRSGITMTAGLFSKLDKKSAAEFSFLMSVPIIALAGALRILEMIKAGGGEVSALALTAGFVASAISGFVAIAGLMKIIQKWSFKPFVVYRIVVGILILFFLV